jgi:protocatechuate 3,4-dioxygenase beta subunit
MSSLSRIHLATAMFIALAIPMRLLGQNVQPTELRRATVIGTATDANGDPVPNATIELKSSDSNDRRTLVTAENGFFEFHDVKPGVSYQISVNANDFADWTSSTITLEPGQFKIATGIKLRIRPGAHGGPGHLRSGTGRD